MIVTLDLALWFCLHRLPAIPNGDTVSTSEQRAATHSPYERNTEPRVEAGEAEAAD